MHISNRLYDALSRLQRWLPALGVFYLALGEIWGLPGGARVNSTIVAAAALLAATLEISSAQYYREAPNGPDPSAASGDSSLSQREPLRADAGIGPCEAGEDPSTPLRSAQDDKAGGESHA